MINFYGVKNAVCLYFVNHVFVGTKYFKIKRKLLQLRGFKIGEGTKVVGPIICTGTLSIGKNCWIGKNFHVNGNGHVKVGDNCDIAPDVILSTGGHKIGDAERRAGEGEIFNITIESGTWIGTRVTVINNTTVGKSCVVAACACITKDVPDNLLVGGIPAKILRELH